MALKRSGYATFNQELHHFARKTAQLKPSIVKSTPGWTSTQTSALDALLANLTTAQTAFPARDETP